MQAIELVNSLRFIQATRDSGYRHLASALSEVVDNSLQAGAAHIDIFLDEHDPPDGSVAVIDDGCGMSRKALAAALQFGGSDRFNDRQGLGRFGMGLPNSSLSQARRVDVYTWRQPKVIWHSFLDLDELLASEHPTLVPPARASLPPKFLPTRSASGTLVVWSRLDKGRPSQWTALAKRLNLRLGQTFRYFLWAGHAIQINGIPVLPYDPLFLSKETRTPSVSASQYGDALIFKIDAAFTVSEKASATVQVRFSELPVSTLSPLTNREKRLFGISNGAGISIIRADREIDYGWFLLDKRRENYDDWWRCEIQFSPELDELFGVTHIKQGIRPAEALWSILSNELSTVARTLNQRVRHAHIALAAEKIEHAAEQTASDRDILLRPLTSTTAMPQSVIYEKRPYHFTTEKIDERVFLQAHAEEGQVMVVLNTLHEVYLNLYRPLLANDCESMALHRKQLELFLLALGRTLLLERTENQQMSIQQFLADWSRAVTVFCGGISNEA